MANIINVLMKTHRLTRMAGDELELRAVLEGAERDVQHTISDLKNMCWLENLKFEMPEQRTTAFVSWRISVLGEPKAVNMIKDYLADLSEPAPEAAKEGGCRPDVTS